MNTYRVYCLGQSLTIDADDEYTAFDIARRHFGWNAPVSYPHEVEGDVARPFPPTTSPS